MTKASIAWVFPGQGSQEVGMGRDLVDAYPLAREIFERADQALGRTISTLCFDGPAEDLNRTYNAQPAIFLTSFALLSVAKQMGLDAEPVFVSGHSLGEYSALAAAGSLSFEDGLRLVETRGRLTQKAADANPGGMAAILGLDEDTAVAICNESGAEVCNFNAPGQIVIGGPKDALTRACALALERGAKRAIPLEVGGAFHTSLMGPAVDAFTQALREANVVEPRYPVVANDSAQPITSPERIRQELAYQLTHPVRWIACVEYMVANGITEFVEIGPGKVLTGLIKRIAPGNTLRNINAAESFA